MPGNSHNDKNVIWKNDTNNFTAVEVLEGTDVFTYKCNYCGRMFENTGRVRKHIGEGHRTGEEIKETEDDSETNEENSNIVKLKLQLKEEKDNMFKLTSELKETKKYLKKSESRCDELVNQMVNLTIAKTKAAAEAARMITLADSLQVLLDAKKEDVKSKDEESKETDKYNSDKTRKINNQCNYWNNINNDNAYINNNMLNCPSEKKLEKTVMEILLERKDNDNDREDFEFSDENHYSEEETDNE